MAQLAIPNWEQSRERHIQWWRQEGLVLHILARREDTARSEGNPQAPFYYLMSGLDTTAASAHPQEVQSAWLEPQPRAALAERYLAGIYYAGEAFPYYDAHLGPGSLATFLGSTPAFAIDTIWYEPCLSSLDDHPPLRFDPDHPWFLKQEAIVHAGLAVSNGRYPVGMPDLVENLDILASLRGTEELLVDMLERPTLVTQRLAEINQAYFAAFDRLYEHIAAPWGGNVFSAFSIWGPGRTAKVQCDLAALISPRMFAELAVPALTEQCAWLDYAMYHLDGTQALGHLQHLLAIDALDAIEWTPQVNVPQGGDPLWYDLYRRILAAGKSIQAINVRPNEVVPLLDAVGTEGVFVMVNARSEADAQALVEKVKPYR